MKTNLTHLVISLLFINLTFSQIAEKNFIDQPYIEVSGQVESEIIPNEIYLNITIDENDKRGRISIEEQENQMIAVLKSLGINLDQSFSVQTFSGYYKRKLFADNEVTKTKSYELLVNNIETLGKVYEALDRMDISNVYIKKTSHTDIEKYVRESKLEALKKAKEKATDYANVLNQTIGKAIFVQEQIPNYTVNSLSGFSNGILIRGQGYINNGQHEIKTQDLNIKSIVIAASVLVKFALN